MADLQKIDWIKTHKQEAVDFVRKFFRTSYDWRNSGSDGYHARWDRFERNYHSIYDPVIRQKKEDWQNTMFIPETFKNVEVINSALFKILMGKRRPIIFEPREMGDELQAELHTSVLTYEIQLSKYIEEFYKTLKESCIFGSGFMKFYWVKRYDNRRIKKPVRLGIFGSAKSAMRGQMESPSAIVDFKEQVEQVLIEDRVRCENVHIRDVFIEPNSKDFSRVLHRQKVTYNELVLLAKEGAVDKESVDELRMKKESDSFETDVAVNQYLFGLTDPALARADYDKNHTLFEYWGMIPRKWTKEGLGMPEDTDAQREKANELISGKILTASGDYYLSCEENPLQSMTHPFLQLDYIKCGQSYGKGVAESMEGLQEEINEIRNLRVDNVNLVQNKMFVIVEKYVRDPKEIRSAPGAIIRVKGNEIQNPGQAIQELQTSPIDIAGYRETQELERQIQETTAANRATTIGAPSGSNSTLGGIELAKAAAYDRFSVYAYVISNFIKESAMKIMELSYQNSSIDRNHKILGDMPIEYLPGQWVPRWQLYKPIAPHEMMDSYDLIPADIFEQENKMQKAQALGSFGQLLASTLKQFDPVPLMRRIAHYNDFTKEETDEILKGIEGPQPTPMALGQGVPSISKTSAGSSPSPDVAPAGMSAGGLG